MRTDLKWKTYFEMIPFDFYQDTLPALLASSSSTVLPDSHYRLLSKPRPTWLQTYPVPNFFHFLNFALFFAFGLLSSTVSKQRKTSKQTIATENLYLPDSLGLKQK